MLRGYNKLEQNSDQNSSSHEIQLNQRLQNQFMRNPRTKSSKVANQSQTVAKMSDIKSIYIDGIVKSRQRQKAKTSQKIDSKVNADELIKVLQNGRERRNLRRKKNQQQPQQVSQEIKPSAKNSEQLNYVSQVSAGSRNTRNYSSLLKSIQASPITTNQPELKIRKVLRQLKDEEKKRQTKIVEQTEWKQIQNLLTCKSQIQSPLNQKQRSKRRHELQAAKQLLTGRVSIIWIFVVSSLISEQDRMRIAKMYSGLSQSPYIVPLCHKPSQIKTFLEVPNSLFKIVADLVNFNQVLKCRINNKVLEFYVLNNEGDKGIAKALGFKSQSRKVKGIYTSLSKIIDRAQQQIQNQIQLYQTKKGILKKNNFKKFPSFMKLSGEDKTYATLYRANLYGSKNVSPSQLKLHYNEFMNLIRQKYGSIQSQKKNIYDYENLNHFGQLTIAEARQVVKFYVRQSFYYQILNSMLRTMKTTEQFRPCIFPFYETYHAIKKFYSKDLQQNNRKIKAQTLYRGARLRSRDFQSLKPGIFIQMFGFMSTSKSLQRAKEFCDRDGYIFIITVPELAVPQKYNKYDHGFVDINKHSLASKQFSVEQQILFNALNVFKITKIQAQGARHLIHMQYGPIFQLLSKPKTELTSDQKDVLLNYQYCANMLDQIEDQGDVFLIANQFEQSKQYYKQKINKNEQDGKYYYKLANVQQQCGQLQQANKNVQVSLKLQLQTLDLNDRQKCLKVFSIHSKNASISLDQQDYLTADQSLTSAIQMLAEENYFQKAQKLRQRGQIKFKKGEIIDAQKDFEQSQNIFKNLTNLATQKKNSINRSYYFSFLYLICSSTTQQEIQKQRQAKIEQVENIQKQIKNMEQLINQELIKVNSSLKQVAHYAEDKQKYEICVKKARAYLFDVQSRKTNDPIQKAKLKALQATIQDYLQLAQSERLLYQAIKLVQSSQPFNPDVGKYSEILGNLQKKELQKFTNPKVLLQTPLTLGMQPIKYNQEQHNKIYKRCKGNFQKAINVLLYNNKTKSSPQVISLKNQLGQLDFYQSKFEESQKVIKEAKQACKQTGHSELSKSCLLLSKISYARGQLKDSFQHVEQSMSTLRSAIVKKQQPKYIAIFQFNNILLEIKLHRSKIYLRQLNHDLSLKDLNEIKVAIQKKTDNNGSHSLLADIYQIKAENFVSKKDDFDSQFQRAIKLRQKQFGQYNLANAVTYCNYSKFLTLINQFQDAEKMLHKALQIFSCFSEEHPITWLVLYCTGLLKQRKSQKIQSLSYIYKSLTKLKQKYDKDHITVNKVRLQYAKSLHKAGKFQEAIKEFQALQIDLQQQINASQARKQIIKQSDDEKISVKRTLYQSLKQSYKEMNKIDQSHLNSTSIALTRCQKKIDELHRSFKFKINQK